MALCLLSIQRLPSHGSHLVFLLQIIGTFLGFVPRASDCSKLKDQDFSEFSGLKR
jgi:hypothetical protein